MDRVFIIPPKPELLWTLDAASVAANPSLFPCLTYITLLRFLQDGRAQRILQDLNNIIVYNETRTDKYGDIDVFFGDWFNRQNWWAIKLTICDGLNLINILLNIFLVDWYLDGNFFTYGPISLRYIFSTPCNL